MPYFVDTNLLVSLHIPPDPNKQDQLIEHKEVVKAFEKLKEQKEALYYSDKILKEVESVAIKKFDLSPEQAKLLVEDIKKDKSLLHIDQKIEREAEKKAEELAKAQRLTELEKQSLKETIKEERSKELAAKEVQERANARKAIADLAKQAKHEGLRKEAKEIIRAKTDVDHVATAKTHGLSVLTN